MPHKINHPRRALVIATTGAAATRALAQTSQASAADKKDRQLQFKSLADAELEVTRLSTGKEWVCGASLNWPQTLVHCTQSIDYSMSGYPQANSRLFQVTIGSAAFGVFTMRGRMSHDLDAPIPGAPSIAPAEDPVKALDRLRDAITRFRHWTGPLKPHFAYGHLDKSEYELAHAMHLANHLSVIDIKG